MLEQRIVRWMVALGPCAPGEAVLALAWLGQAQVHEAVSKLHSTRSESEWTLLLASRSILPIWTDSGYQPKNTHV